MKNENKGKVQGAFQPCHLFYIERSEDVISVFFLSGLSNANKKKPLPLAAKIPQRNTNFVFGRSVTKPGRAPAT